MSNMAVAVLDCREARRHWLPHACGNKPGNKIWRLGEDTTQEDSNVHVRT